MFKLRTAVLRQNLGNSWEIIALSFMIISIESQQGSRGLSLSYDSGVIPTAILTLPKAAAQKGLSRQVMCGPNPEDLTVLCVD